ncbi:MAG: hypothetical protein D6689_13875, partial [Deltaproteobacteria bacterium]
MVCAVVGALAAPAVARADSRAVKAIERKNREAMENYDLLDYEAAKKGLTEALALAKRSKLDRHKVVAQTHMFLGIVEFSGFGDRDAALVQFIDAVSIDPTIEIPTAYRSQEVDALLAEARAQSGGTRGGGDVRPAVDCGSVSGMQHDLVDEADAGVDRQITAHV